MQKSKKFLFEQDGNFSVAYGADEAEARKQWQKTHTGNPENVTCVSFEPPASPRKKATSPKKEVTDNGMGKKTQ